MRGTPDKAAVSQVCVQRINQLLWPRGVEQGRVFAILDGARDQRIFGAVDAARVDRTCLYSLNLRWPGEELPWKLIGASPYLVELEKDTDLTRFVISNGWHDHWGIYCRANADLKQLRRHFRELLVVNDHRGRRLMFRYYDPRVLRVYLPSCRPDELRAFFGPVDELIVPAPNPCTAIQYRFDGSRLLRKIFEFQEAQAPEPRQIPAGKPAVRGTPAAARKISFVVTARDEPQEILETTIDGLIETNGGHHSEILLIDDGSAVPIALERPGLKIVRNQAARGVAQSRRSGAAMASGDVLVFVDAHMRFAPDWLERLLEHVDSGAFLCAAWWDYELTRALCWGGEYVWCGDRDYHTGKSPGFSFRHLTKYPGPGAVDVPLAVGACYMVLRQSYERMGGFSPHFKIWGKCEQDMSARAWITGVGVKCVTGAHVGHLSRKKFRYPVSWSDIEFNQVAMLRTVFEEATVRTIEPLMHPLPGDVQTWLGETDFGEWRKCVQSQRTMSDAAFFHRFVSNAPPALVDHLRD